MIEHIGTFRAARAARNRHLLLCGVLMQATWFAPAIANAQFQDPTPDELKMTSDPKAPGAAAVYLDIREIDDDPLQIRIHYERIKVLSEKGRNLANVEIPYGDNWTVSDINGRTIHSDGTIFPLSGTPEALLAEKQGGVVTAGRRFTMPSVEVGSVIEFQYKVRYRDFYFSSPIWKIQRPYLIHRATYSFEPMQQFWPGAPGSSSLFVSTATRVQPVDSHGFFINTLMCWKDLPKDADFKQDLNGRFTLNMNDVPPTPDEEYMPPEDTFLYRVFFYYTASPKAGGFWESEAKYWQNDVDHLAEVTATIQLALYGIVSRTDSVVDKAKKIYAAVEALNNTNYSPNQSALDRQGLKPEAAKRAEDTWREKGGSSSDIAALYLAMLRADGVAAYPIKVVRRDKRVFDPTLLRLSQLDDILVVLNDAGNETILDPGEKMCPFGKLGWEHAETSGIGRNSKGSGLIHTPAQSYIDNTTSRNADLTIDPQGKIYGTMTVVFNGQAALSWRQRALNNDVSELKKEFNQDMEKIVPDGIEARVDHFLGLDSPETNLLAVINVKGVIGTRSGNRLLLPGLVLESRTETPFMSAEKRLEPVDMHYPERIIDTITYHLSRGMTVDEAPRDSTVSWAGHAMLSVKSKPGADGITITYSLSRNFSTAKPEEYQDLRGFYQKVAAKDQEQLVLTSATATKAN